MVIFISHQGLFQKIVMYGIMMVEAQAMHASMMGILQAYKTQLSEDAENET